MPLLPDLQAMELGPNWKGGCDGLSRKTCQGTARLRIGMPDGVCDLCERCWKTLCRRHDRAELRAVEAAMNGEFSILNPGVHLIKP